MADVDELLGEGRFCYYSILGICRQASEAEIRVAYRKLALKWHPDRWMKDPKVAGDANRKFQKIQEAYSVLSNKRKRSIYDAGILDLLGDDDEDEGFCEFMQEMASMIKSNQKSQENNSLEDLQRLFAEMVNEAEEIEIAKPRFSLEEEPINGSSKRKRWSDHSVTRS